ncbi:hypothetical protein BU15DRAFT_63062 [Melanogaster broomeanus]|nr:hypothetical protein BU15DRAFT_63062 [Melanogaster broomeanus]
MNPMLQPSPLPTTMSNHTDYSTISEPECLSDSDWLDIASTDRESDNESISSSRGADHERLSSRSRSRQSSLSYGSSRDGDVDVWEGLIEDSADEGMPDAVLAHPSSHVPPVSQDAGSSDINPTEEISPEELREKEALDQSMISTLSSSRSSSLHASTVHNSSRDLRLSFPDPITSSREELLSSSYEDVQSPSDTTFSVTDPDLILDLQQTEDDEDMLSASQVLPPQLQHPEAEPVQTPVGTELKVSLYGLSSPFKWSMIDKLLQKVVDGAGLTTTTDLESLEGPLRQLVVNGHSERDRSFPHIITVIDRTHQQHDTEDPASMNIAAVPSLAVVYMPSRPPRLPEHVLYLPVLASPGYSIELPEFKDVDIGSARGMWDMFNVPDHQLLRITASGESAGGRQTGDRWVGSNTQLACLDNVWLSSQLRCSPVLTGVCSIAILSLVLGVVVRSSILTSTQPVINTVVTPESNCTPNSIWQLLRPVVNRERQALSATPDTPVVVMPSSFKDFALSVFNADSTSVSLPRANPTTSRRMTPSTLSERLRLSKDLMLRPKNRPKALSVIPETSATAAYRSDPASTHHSVSALIHTSLPSFVKEYAPVVSAIVNQDIQDILDALDALVQAISKQAQVFLTQTTALIQYTAAHLENGRQSWETVKETVYTRNERAQRRAREIKEQAAKWLYDAGEAFTTGAQLSKEKAQEVAEELANRAQRARGKAKEMAEDIQELLSEHEEAFEALRIRAWDVGAKEWTRWHRQAEESEKTRWTGKPCKLTRRQRKQTIIC